MRGRDEETGEFHDKSRSQNRRDALDVLALGETLVSLPPPHPPRLPVPHDLLPPTAHANRSPAHIAPHRPLPSLATPLPSRKNARSGQCPLAAVPGS